MGNANKSFRIRTDVGHDSMVNVNFDNTVNTLEILSLKLDQTNTYKLMSSDIGVVAGRVLANGGFGIPNAKISVFIPYETTDDMYKSVLYHFQTTSSLDYDGIKYNLLSSISGDDCHQSVGSFPTKQVMLDNDSWIEVFDKYYKYTTKTNNSGDYMIYGVPVGNQTIHCDIDLSDIGVLSQSPRDLIYKGYNANLFDSPSKFKKDTNLNSLSQLVIQDKTTYVYPYWGDTTDNTYNACITRCDINVDYKFEPTCIFMGSAITDTGENAMSKTCIAAKYQGKMSEMTTGEGSIEMIRKTFDGKIEQFSVKGNRVIDSDGTWCYQIPMNLDYVVTDEYGNTVLSDDPTKGVATRTRVRFRISMDDALTDSIARKRARYLVPNNPRLVEEDYPKFTESKDVDYEFGTKTKDENFRDLMWNKVYTVKSYIPRIQKSLQPLNWRHLGIKMVNHSNGHNPMPFNNLSIKFNFTYLFLCALTKVIVSVVVILNKIWTSIGWAFYNLGKFLWNAADTIKGWSLLGWNFGEGLSKIFAKEMGDSNEFEVIKSLSRVNDDTAEDFFSLTMSGYEDWGFGELMNGQWDYGDTGGLAAYFMLLAKSIGCGITLSGLCEDDNGVSESYNPGVNKNMAKVFEKIGKVCNSDISKLYNCIENQLAQDNEVTSFNFYNDWVNGVLYFPLWFRNIKPKKKIFGITFSGRDQWCSSEIAFNKGRRTKRHLKLYHTCAQTRELENSNGIMEKKLKPLENEEDTVIGIADSDYGYEKLFFSEYSDKNCYGYKCHRFNRSFTPIDNGLIVSKQTMLDDTVFYYKPCVYDAKYNKDIVTLFATDIVLLGSLNGCDLDGIPQFFRALTGTTYNMPPSLLVEDYDYKSEMKDDEHYAEMIDEKTRFTEYTGADWGNLGVDQTSTDDVSILSSGIGNIELETNENKYDNGGLFYGLTCFNSYMKPKSCINLARICEFGVSLDESQDILDTSKLDANTTDETAEYSTLTPDGFISYDDIYNMDYRSMFATMNGNWLKTKRDFNTGLIKYDFNHLYPENFDGSMSKLMAADTTRNGYTKKSEYTQRANYVNNYKLEESSDSYLNFRYGNYKKYDENNSATNKIYFYTYNDLATTVNGNDVYTGWRIPRFENSFYFYFGLNEGKTAIDKFRSTYFAECVNDSTAESAYDITFVGNSWCGEEDGYVAFDTNMQEPITVTFTNKENLTLTYTTNPSTKSKFYVGSNGPSGYEHVTFTDNTSQLPIGSYKVTIVDSDENVYNDTLNFYSDYLSYDYNGKSFNVKNKDLEETFAEYYDDGTINWKDTFSAIANYKFGASYPYTRPIHGEIIISNVSVGDYKVEIYPTDTELFGKSVYCVRTINGKSYPLTILTTNGGYPYNYYAYFPDDTDDDYVVPTMVAFKMNENSPITSSDETQYLVYESSNYPGASIEVHNNVVTEHEGSVGYLWQNILNHDLYFGVPYGETKYKVIVTQLCYDEDTESYYETENSITQFVTIGEYVFKMYINGIDYDLISNFKTGWVEGSRTTMNAYTNTNNFDQSKMYGWNKLSNIGSYYDESTMTKGDVSVIDTTPSYVIANKETIALIGDVLSSDYEGNGVPYQKQFTAVTAFGVLTYNKDISTPYTWSMRYCYDSNDWSSDRDTILNAELIDNDLTDDVKNILDHMNLIIEDRIDFTRNVMGAFRSGIDETNMTITYRSGTDGEIKVLCIGNGEIVVQTAMGRLISQTEFKCQDITYQENSFDFVLPTITSDGTNFIPKMTTRPKLPYYVAIQDENKATVPGKGSGLITRGGSGMMVVVDNFDGNESTDQRVDMLFGVHFYNKSLYLGNVRLWCGMHDKIVYDTASQEPVINDCGAALFGNAYNGIVDPTVTFNNTEIHTYQTSFDGGEMDLLSEKTIGSEIPTDSKFGEYNLVDIDGNFFTGYAEVPAMNTDAVISDGYGSDYSMELYGSMYINISGSTFASFGDPLYFNGNIIYQELQAQFSSVIYELDIEPPLDPEGDDIYYYINVYGNRINVDPHNPNINFSTNPYTFTETYNPPIYLTLNKGTNSDGENYYYYMLNGNEVVVTNLTSCRYIYYYMNGNTKVYTKSNGNLITSEDLDGTDNVLNFNSGYDSTTYYVYRYEPDTVGALEHAYTNYEDTDGTMKCTYDADNGFTTLPSLFTKNNASLMSFSNFVGKTTDTSYSVGRCTDYNDTTKYFVIANYGNTYSMSPVIDTNIIRLIAERYHIYYIDGAPQVVIPNGVDPATNKKIYTYTDGGGTTHTVTEDDGVVKYWKFNKIYLTPRCTSSIIYNGTEYKRHFISDSPYLRNGFRISTVNNDFTEIENYYPNNTNDVKYFDRGGECYEAYSLEFGEWNVPSWSTVTLIDCTGVIHKISVDEITEAEIEAAGGSSPINAVPFSNYANGIYFYNSDGNRLVTLS